MIPVTWRRKESDADTHFPGNVKSMSFYYKESNSIIIFNFEIQAILFKYQYANMCWYIIKRLSDLTKNFNEAVALRMSSGVEMTIQ